MIYFDNAATTKPNIDAVNKASVFLTEKYFNPSALYNEGIQTFNEIKETKKALLGCLGLSEDNYQVIFTSCGSESDNTAIFCSKKRGVFLTDKGEHSAVFKSFTELKNKGQNVVFIDLNSDGSVNTDKLYNYIKNNQVDFVSIVHVNNETGAINDIVAISKEIKSINPNIIFHSDGVQAFGKIPFTFTSDIDLYSISAHKIGGIKGIGALIKKKSLNLSPLIFGGGQEFGLRSGTENVFGIKTFEYASKFKYENIKQNFEYVKEIKNYVEENLDKNLFKIISKKTCSPYILSISAVNLKGEIIMHLLEEEGIIVGNGSACSSKNPHSRIIESCGYKSDVLSGMIRISFSPENTLEEAKILIEKLNSNAKKLKGIMG